MRPRQAALACALAVAALLFGAPAPQVSLALRDSAGRKVRLRDLRGKPVLLNFWATWCGPCKDELPMLVALEKEYAPRGVAFVAASLDEARDQAKVAEFAKDHGVNFAIWYGASGDDLDRLKLGDAIPATVFLDTEGQIVARILGEAREAEVRERLEWLTGKREGPPPKAMVKHLPDRAVQELEPTRSQKETAKN